MGWRFIWFASRRFPEPPKELHCWTKAPRIHFFERYPTKAAGPTCHLPCPVQSVEAVGKIKVGPSPRSQLPTSFGLGENISIKTVSPNPVVRSMSAGLYRLEWGTELKTVTTGLVMRFQSPVSAT